MPFSSRYISVCKTEMAALWLYITGFLLMISWCAVHSQSEELIKGKFTVPAYKSGQDKKLEVKEAIPRCVVSYWPSDTTFVPSQIPNLTCTCYWPDNATQVVYPRWRLLSSDARLVNRFSSNATETTALLTFPSASEVHTGKELYILLTWIVPKIIEKPKFYYLKVQKSGYNGTCQEDDDCFVNNMTCSSSLCQCLPGLTYQDGYGCYSEILPTCNVSSWYSDVIYIPSQIPKVTCTCVWPDNATDVVYPEWVLESYLEDVILENRLSSNITETAAVFTFPADSRFHKGLSMPLILAYRLPGIDWKSKNYTLELKKSKIYEDCQEADDCYFSNSTCVWNQCKCASGFHYLKSHGCYSGKHLGESCEIPEECSSLVFNSYCSGSKKCECEYPYQKHGEICGISGKYLGESCENSQECSKYDANSDCFYPGICKCKYPYERNGKICEKSISGVSLGEKCETSAECMKRTDNSYCTYSGICDCHYPYRRVGSYCVDSSLGVHLGDRCEWSSECTMYTSNSFCSSGICACKYPYEKKGLSCFYSNTDSRLPVFFYVIIGVIVIGFLGLVSRILRKRRLVMSGQNRGLASPGTGVIVSGPTTVQVPERRDYPPAYSELTSRQPQRTILETPPPGYDQWQQAPAFHFQASMTNAPTAERAATSPVTTSPTRSISTEQGQSNAAFVSDRQT